jgi:hypothetical protein
MFDPNDLPKFDAGTYQKPLGALAEVLALKLSREATKLIRPAYAAIDMHVMLRVAMRVYDLLHYINADERREKDTDWRLTYTISSLPLVRNMIDCLYNITAVLQDPGVNAPWYRKSGYRKAFLALEEDKERYGGQQKWDDWIDASRRALDFAMRDARLTITEVMAQKEPWPTLGKYLGDRQPGGGLTPHQQFLRTFTYGFWREYSAIAHSGFEGLMLVGMYYVPDSFPYDDREKLEIQHIGVLSLHVPRAALILLCIVTELQAYFRFDGADINKRIHAMWTALMPLFDAKELYDERYRQLMIDKRIENW